MLNQENVIIIMGLSTVATLCVPIVALYLRKRRATANG